MELTDDERLAPPWPPVPLAIIRIGRVALTVVLGLAVLVPPHLLWLLLKGGAPSPFARLFHRLLTAATRIRIEVHGRPLEPDALAVANHVSWSDVLVLGSVSPAAFVAKSDVRGWPVLGALAALQPTLFIERTKRGSAAVQVAAVARALARGRVVMFPEGTTGDGSSVLPFRSALLAAARGRALRPVAIRYRERRRGAWGPAGLAAWAWDGDKPFGPHFLRVLASGGALCRVDLLDPIGRGLDRKAAAEVSRLAIATSLALPPASGAAWTDVEQAKPSATAER